MKQLIIPLTIIICTLALCFTAIHITKLSKETHIIRTHIEMHKELTNR